MYSVEVFNQFYYSESLEKLITDRNDSYAEPSLMDNVAFSLYGSFGCAK